MPKPPNKEFNLKARIEKLKAAGFNCIEEKEVALNEEDALKPLPERIQMILGIIRSEPIKSTTMNYLILYDIEKNKIRSLISKYLISMGCIRIQKSVFLAHTDHKKFDVIKTTLAEINEVYENKDSIILVPLNVSDARSMKLIGQNVNIDQIIDPPNTVFI
ncbi:MAG: CRISPR-associated endonuclease Cas2 [Bacteroidetes bacterium]|nr:CRISPR-associated endonuclease Cas2 [Bacteroidota bacterium]